MKFTKEKMDFGMKWLEQVHNLGLHKRSKCGLVSEAGAKCDFNTKECPFAKDNYDDFIKQAIDECRIMTAKDVIRLFKCYFLPYDNYFINKSSSGVIKLSSGEPKLNDSDIANSRFTVDLRVPVLELIGIPWQESIMELDSDGNILPKKREFPFEDGAKYFLMHNFIDDEEYNIEITVATYNMETASFIDDSGDLWNWDEKNKTFVFIGEEEDNGYKLLVREIYPLTKSINYK